MSSSRASRKRAREINAASADLQEVVEGVMTHCPWTGGSTPAQLVEYTRSELAEIEVELRAGDAPKLESELGDLFFDAFLLAATCRREHGIDVAAAFRGAAAKVRRRCPHVFANEQAHSKVEAAAIWQREKAKERAAVAAAAAAAAAAPRSPSGQQQD